MKLLIQIPCFNEEEALPKTMADLPRAVPGFDAVEWLVIDDGSADRTAAAAREAGADHVVSHRCHKGLATAFQTGLDACLERGADVIVNTDADLQYPGRYIADLTAPILAGDADMTIGDRRVGSNRHFPLAKKLLQLAGSAIVRWISGTKVPDAPSGFRAFSRDAALRLNVLTDYTYTLETVIQAGKNNLSLAHVDIETNPPMRPSRLMRSTPGYVLRSAITLLRLFALYEPLKTFFYIGLPFFLCGGALWLRYLVLLYLEGAQRGAHIQSVVVGAAALLSALFILCLGIVGDLLAKNRLILERNLYLAKRRLYREHRPDDDETKADVLQ